MIRVRLPTLAPAGGWNDGGNRLRDCLRRKRRPYRATANAFAWTEGSKDAACVLSLQPGAYTAVVRGQNGGTGIVLLEAYEVDTANHASELVNLSTRSMVKTADAVQIAGFIISGTAPQKVLIRASGPALTQYGVSNVLADPVLEIHDATQATIATNDDWDSGLQASFQQLNINNWQLGSKDAAISLTLNPGAYTAVVSGKNGGMGNALVEVFITQ